MNIEALIADLLLTAFAYLIVPIILAIRKKEVNAKKVAIVNGIVVWFIFSVIKINLGINQTSGAVFIWSGVAYYILKKKCSSKQSNLSKDASRSMQSRQSNNNITYSLSPIGEEPPKYGGGHNITGRDIMYDENIKQTPIPPIYTAQKEEQHKQANSTEHVPIESCKKTDNKTSNIYKVLCAILLAITVIIAINTLNLSKENEDLKLDNTFLQYDIEEYEETLNQCVDLGLVEKEDDDYILVARNYKKLLKFYNKNYYKVNFMDEHIVFVLDGYGNYYYTYDQIEKVTRGVKEYSYWAYNKNAAISQGYIPWK